MNAAVLTVSDGVSAGVREDKSGDALEELLREDGFDVVRQGRLRRGAAHRRARSESLSTTVRCSY